MKTLKLILIAVVLLVATTITEANQVGASYTETYTYHGFPVFGSDYVHPGLSTSIQGIDVAAITHLGEAHDDIEYWDILLGCDVPLKLPVDLKAGYGYFILPGVDVQEFQVTASLPGDISPRYTFAYVVPDIGDTEGQLHIVGIDVRLGEIAQGISADLSVEATYNNGVNPFGSEDIQDWTHLTNRLIIDVPIAKNISLRPGCVYQHTFVEAVHSDRNEVWAVAGLNVRF
jgi:hypothetical protein